MQVAGDPKVYVVQNGQKTWVETAAEFNAAGYKWGDIQIVSPQTLATFPEAASVGSASSGAAKASVNTRLLNVRSAPALTGSIITKAKLGETYPVLGHEGTWTNIQLPDGTPAWVASAYLTESVAPVAAAVPASVPVTGEFKVTLSVGQRGQAVRALQQFLVNQGPDIYPEGLVTGYFGSLTSAAVERFQGKYGIAGAGEAGYGVFGPKTRAKANGLN